MAIQAWRSQYSMNPPPEVYREIEAAKARKAKRFEINGKALTILQENNSQHVRDCRFFKYQYGGPKFNTCFQLLFEKFFVFIRGRDSLASRGASQLISTISSFGDSRYHTMQPHFSDVYWETRGAGFDGSYVESRIPTYAVKRSLETIVDENCGLFRDFIVLLKQENRGIETWAEIDSRWNGQERSFSACFKGLLFGFALGIPLLLYNKLGDELKEIYSRLLAIKWLEQDQQRLAIELFTQFVPRSLPIFLPQHYFYFEDTRFVTYPTLGDGACALQALLGEKIDGEYRYRGNVRKAFTDALREQRHHPIIQQHLLNILKSHLDNIAQDPSSAMLFSNIADRWPYDYIVLKRDIAQRLNLLKKQEATLWMEELQGETFREKFLEVRRNDRLRGGKAPETPEQVLESLKQDSFSILSTVCGEEDQFIPLLGGPQQRHLFHLRYTQKLVEDRETQEGDRILLSEKAFNHYVQVVQQDAFWFNAQEIELASHLFNKKTRLFSVVQEGEARHLTSQLFNPDLDVETTYIFHRPGHFSRAAPSDELTLLDFILSYTKSQQRAEIQIERDIVAQNLLASTARQEICQLGFSGGASFFTANPFPIAAQAVKSFTSIATAYLDPFRDSQISSWSEAAVLPVFQLATGGPLKTIAVSFVVDQSIRKLCDWDKEENGIDRPELVKRLMITPISALADKDPVTKIVSGLFGSFIKCGMNGALHKWEEYCDIDEAYWINNPSWGQCFVKAFATNDASQEVMTSWLVKAIEPKKKEGDEPVNVDEVDLEEDQREEGVEEVVVPLEDIDRSHLLDHSPESVNIKYKVRESNGEYYIDLYKDGLYKKQAGKAPSKEKAQKFCDYANSLVSQINTLNKQSYEEQCLYESLGLSPKDMPATLLFDMQYFEMDAAGKKGTVYLNGQRIFKGTGFKSALVAVKNKAEQLLSQDRNQLENYKANLKAKSPAYIQQPNNALPIVQQRQNGEKYYLFYTDQNGKQVSIGEYTAEDARFVSGAWSFFQAKRFNLELQAYEAQVILIEQGVDIAIIPDRPQFEIPELSGNKAGNNHTAIQAARIRNDRLFQAYLNKLNQLSSSPIITHSMTKVELVELAAKLSPKIKDPKEHGFWYNAWREIGTILDNASNFLRDIGVENAHTGLIPVSPLYSEPKSASSTYHENQMDLAYQGGIPSTTLGHAGPHGLTWNNPSPSNPPSTQPMQERPTVGDIPWTWESHQDYTEYQLMQTLQTPPANSHHPQTYHPLDLTNPTQALELAHRELWGRGYVPSSSQHHDTFPHLPVMQTASLIQSMGLSSVFFTSQEGDSRDLVMIVNNDFVKSLPKGVGRAALGALKLLVPDMSDVPGVENPHDHLDRIGYHLGRCYDEVVQIKDPLSFSTKAGTFTGELLAFGSIGKVIRIAELPGVFCAIAEGGTIGAIFAQAENQNPLEGALVGGVLGGGLHKLVGLFHFPKSIPSPLTDRALQIHPGKYSGELNCLERINRPAFRGGVGRQGQIPKIVNPSLPIERGGRGIGKFQYSEGTFTHFDQIVVRGIHKGKLERPYMRSLQTIEEIMNTKPPVSDPRGVPGLLWWKVPGKFRGAEGYWELLLNPEDNMICHFNFKT
jgi:hypothetical protein